MMLITGSASLELLVWLGLAASGVFLCAVCHVDSTHRLALSLLCLIGSGVYLVMVCLNVIYHDAGSIAIASALFAASNIAAFYLRRKGADPWPPDDDAAPREQPNKHCT
jgi:hypothetical protein